jgi:transposase
MNQTMLHHKAFKYRIYPNQEQIVQLRKTLGCSRFVFNHLLEKWNQTYQATGEGLSYNACASQLPAMNDPPRFQKLQASRTKLHDAVYEREHCYEGRSVAASQAGLRALCQIKRDGRPDPIGYSTTSPKRQMVCIGGV